MKSKLIIPTLLLTVFPMYVFADFWDSIEYTDLLIMVYIYTVIPVLSWVFNIVFYVLSLSKISIDRTMLKLVIGLNILLVIVTLFAILMDLKEGGSLNTLIVLILMVIAPLYFSFSSYIKQQKLSDSSNRNKKNTFTNLNSPPPN